MLSLFPSLLAFGPLGPLVLRLVLGVVLVYWAYSSLKQRKTPLLTTLGLIEGVMGILLIIGLFTQGAALVTAIILVTKLVNKIKEKAFFTSGVNYYFILLIVALSLLVLGAGAFAFDYPL